MANGNKNFNVLSAFDKIGILTNNRFDVMFEIPRCLISKLPNLNETHQYISMFCTNITVPVSGDIKTSSIRTSGPDFTVPNEMNSSGIVTMTFFYDGNGKNHNMFRDWIEAIYSYKSKTLGWYSDFVTDVHVMFKVKPSVGDYSKVDNICEIIYHNAYPTTIQPLDANGSTSSSAVVLQVALNYKNIEVKFKNDKARDDFWM